MYRFVEMSVLAAVPVLLCAEAMPESRLALDGGAEVRFREELKHEIPGTGLTAKKSENLLRLRSRAWGSASYEDCALYGRLANEFRVYTARPGKNNAGMATYEFPDELYLDSLYLDVKNVAGGLMDLRFGRQEMKYGDGRIILDGSAADGQRSQYFNALKATLHVTEQTALDAFGIYMPDHDAWAVGPFERPMDTLGSVYTDNEESGAGLYLSAGEVKEFPFELYYVWKNETHSHNRGDHEFGRDFHTFGTRLLPTWSERVSCEVELAAQAGKTDDGRDILGYMGYGGLTCLLAPETAFKPYLTAAALYLSGDGKPNSGGDSNWSPVFNRTTWMSTLVADQYKSYRWANLVYPQLAGGVTVFTNQKFRFHTGPMFAVEDDQASNGGGDTYKGYLTFLRYEATLWKGLFGSCGDLFHAVQCEVFEPGEYFDADATAVFLRWEVTAKF